MTQSIARRYEIGEVLHEGAGVLVLSAEDRARPGSALVLKCVKGRPPEGARALRLESEYRCLSSLIHPGAPRVVDFGYDIRSDRTWMVSERAPGLPLDQLPILPLRTVVEILADVVRVLAQLHGRGLLHLDIKRRNILYDGATRRTTLLDYDLATTPANAFGRGTLPYAAPEVMDRRSEPDARADIFSLGVVFHEMLTGKPAGADVHLNGCDPGGDHPRWARDLVVSLTAIDRSRRPVDSRAVIAALGASGVEVPFETASTRRAVWSCAPFIGRETETRAALATIPAGRNRRGRGRVVVVTAGAGLGKSRFLSKLAVDWRSVGVRVVDVGFVRAPERTMQCARMLLERVKAEEGEQASSERLQSCEHERREAVFDRLTSAILKAVRPRRTVLCLDDVHLWDEASRDFLIQFLRRLTHETWEARGRAPVEVVLAYDPGAVPDGRLQDTVFGLRTSDAAECIELQTFSAAETEEFLSRGAAPETPRPDLSAYLQERSGGVPAYLVELLQGNPSKLPSQGTRLGRMSGALVSDLIELPRSLEQRVAGRLAHLAESELKVLRVLALFPNGAVQDLLAELFPDVPELSRVLLKLDDAGILAHSDVPSRARDRWLIPDATTRDVLTAGLPRAVTMRVHAAALQILPRHGARPQELAWHELRGPNPRAGLSTAHDLVPRLLAQGGDDDAAEILKEVKRHSAISPFAARWAELLLVDISLRQGALASARAMIDAARRRAEAQGGSGLNERPLDLPWLRRAARVAAKEGRIDEGRELLETVRRSKRALSSMDDTALGLEIAELLSSAGRLSESRDVVLRLEPSFQALVRTDAWSDAGEALESMRAPRLRWPGPKAPLLSRYLNLCGELARADGNLPFGLRCAYAVLKIESRRDDPIALGRALHGVGTILLAGGSVAAAESWFRRALKVRESAGDLSGLTDSANNLGVVLRKLQRSNEAIEQFRTSLKLRRQIGHLAGEASSYVNIANVYYERRELEAAARYLKRALELATRLRDRRTQSQVLNNLGAVAHLRDRYRTAIRCYREAERLDRELGNRRGCVLKRLNLALEYVRIGWVARAEKLLDSLSSRAELSSDAELEVRLQIIRARCHIAAGRPESAMALLESRVASVPNGASGEVGTEVLATFAEAAVSASKPQAALEALLLQEGPVSWETKAELSIVEALAKLQSGSSDFSEVLAVLQDSSKAAKRSRLSWLHFRCARVLALLFERMGDALQAHTEFSSAFEALEDIFYSQKGGRVLEGLAGTRVVLGFADDLHRFGRGLVRSGGVELPEPAASLTTKMRDSLFEAQRRVGPRSAFSRRQEETVHRLFDLSRSLKSTAPPKDLLREVVIAVVEFSGAERAFLINVDGKGRIRVAEARTKDDVPIDDATQQISQRIVQEVFRTGKSIRIGDALDDSGFGSQESVVNLNLRSIMCVPLSAQDQVVGMLYVDNRTRTGQFSPQDLELLGMFAAQVSIALENARLVREFARSERLRVMGNLASGVAHDFNNLLAAIIGRTEEVLASTSSEDARKSLRTILKAATDGAQVVRRMQDFTRVRRDTAFEPIRLSSVVDDVIEFTRSQWEALAGRRGAVIRVTSDVSKEFVVMANPSELREVCTNLVLNSVAALPRGGSIRFTAKKQGDRVGLKVHDDGVGMSEEVRESIFDPFFTTRGNDGMGLGMSIVYGIILRHQGKISVESAQGDGTTITIDLPLADVREYRAASRSTPRPAISGGDILVVDDDQSVRELLGDVLRRAGFTVRTAADGQSALSAFETQPSDVVLTDLGMRPMTGWDVAREVKKRSPSVAIMLITGWAAEIDQATAAKRGIDAIVTKPFEIETLVSAVTQAVFCAAERRKAMSGSAFS